jgi:hypothetical protein
MGNGDHKLPFSLAAAEDVPLKIFYRRHARLSSLAWITRSYDLPTLFTQGARVILLRPANWAKHSFGPWLTTAAKPPGENVSAHGQRQLWDFR